MPGPRHDRRALEALVVVYEALLEQCDPWQADIALIKLMEMDLQGFADGDSTAEEIRVSKEAVATISHLRAQLERLAVLNAAS